MKLHNKHRYQSYRIQLLRQNSKKTQLLHYILIKPAINTDESSVTRFVIARLYGIYDIL
jgi:hypothetical protein